MKSALKKWRQPQILRYEEGLKNENIIKNKDNFKKEDNIKLTIKDFEISTNPSLVTNILWRLHPGH